MFMGHYYPANSFLQKTTSCNNLGFSLPNMNFSRPNDDQVICVHDSSSVLYTKSCTPVLFYYKLYGCTCLLITSVQLKTPSLYSCFCHYCIIINFVHTW